MAKGRQSILKKKLAFLQEKEKKRATFDNRYSTGTQPRQQEPKQAPHWACDRQRHDNQQVLKRESMRSQDLHILSSRSYICFGRLLKYGWCIASTVPMRLLGSYTSICSSRFTPSGSRRGTHVVRACRSAAVVLRVGF